MELVINDITSCPICMEQYSEPKTLPCIHTFCLKCLVGFIGDKLPGDESQCPLCRHEFAIPRNGVSGFPINFFIQRLLDMKESSAMMTSSQSICDQCKSSDTSNQLITAFCIDCKKTLCEGCRTSHSRFMQTKTHRIIDKSSLLADPGAMKSEAYLRSNCTKHPGSSLELYCLVCEENICFLCVVTYHREHAMRGIKEVAVDCREKLTTGTSELADIVTKLDKSVTKMGRKLEEITQQALAKKDKISRREVNEETMALLSTLESREHSRRKEISFEMEEINVTKVGTVSILRYVEELLKRGSPSEITAEWRLMRNRMQEMKSDCQRSLTIAKTVCASHLYLDDLKEEDDGGTKGPGEPTEAATGDCGASCQSRDRREINLILLGETGVGKSTWINGFVNYLTYTSLNEAAIGEQVSPIPSKFTLTGKNMEQVTIQYGHDSNESTDTWQAVTQYPRTYAVETAELIMRIIDTPGIGDRRGIEKDRENLANIMAHLSHYDELHGIIVLLKPNNARLNIMFQFCIKELLTHLHKEASKNIVICFTNARSTFYRPGDTMPALQKLIADGDSIEINLNRDTVYCMDNESVRFLMAVQGGVDFDDNEKAEYGQSWQKSVDEVLRMVLHMTSLTPHRIKNTLSVNDFRRLIEQQSRPVAEIARIIQANILAIADKEREEISVKDSIRELRGKLKVPRIDLQAKQLLRPRTVCTNVDCVETVTAQNKQRMINYKTTCHASCHIKTQPNVINCTALQHCVALRENVDKCLNCSCPWNKHMHLTYDIIEVEVLVDDEAIKKLLEEKDGAIAAIEEHKKRLREAKDQWEADKLKLIEVSAKLACFLKHQAIAPYNDALIEYFNHLIEVEKSKVGIFPFDSKTLDGLKELKESYEVEINVLEQAIDSNDADGIKVLDVVSVQKSLHELQDLPLAGDILKRLIDNIEQAGERVTSLGEKVVRIKSRNRLSSQENAWSKISKHFSSGPN